MLLNKKSNEQRTAYNVLRNEHKSHIKSLLASIVSDESNLESLWPYVRTIGNPLPRIVDFLSVVHSRPVVRTTGDEVADEAFARALDFSSIAQTQAACERLANACGDAFAIVYFSPSGKIKTKAVPPHRVLAVESAGDDIVRVILSGDEEVPGERVVRYAVDPVDPDWGISCTWPLVELALEVGVQLALFLETGYLRSHEQLSIDSLPPETSPGDLGQIPIGTRKLLTVPVRSVKLIDPDTAKKFFEGLVDLTIFCAESYGIPKDYFLQVPGNVGYPPALRDRWARDCAKWAVCDRELLRKAAAVAAAAGYRLPEDVDWIVQYAEPRGFAGPTADLDRVEREIALGINNPVWHAYATDGDFRSLREAREWVLENLRVWGEIVEEKARRNMAVEAADQTPSENGAARGTLEPDYDGAAGPRALPPLGFAK